ncbi:MAG: XdhC family protein, partial [Paracoccaceae bacterium]
MIDLSELSDHIEMYGTVARVVIARHAGSAPREAGTSMLVWRDGQAGTIGGGRLELDAVARARVLLEQG